MIHCPKFSPPLAALVLLAAGLCPMEMARAFSITLTSGPPRIFLHVGNGTGYGDNSSINQVRVLVPVNQIGSGMALPMLSDSSQATSLSGSGNTTCPNPSRQVMVGAAYRRPNANARDAVLQAISPANLTSAEGDNIPFSEISWTVSAAGSPNPNVIPAGSFNGATQTLTSIPVNTYIENCHSFTYANRAVRPAGTYTGQVTYTLSTP